MLLLVVLVLLQYRVWVGDGSLAELRRLQMDVQAQRRENESLAARNRLLEAEVVDLKGGLEAIEERARRELGMVLPGETFYLVVDRP